MNDGSERSRSIQAVQTRVFMRTLCLYLLVGVFFVFDKVDQKQRKARFAHQGGYTQKWSSQSSKVARENSGPGDVLDDGKLGVRIITEDAVTRKLDILTMPSGGWTPEDYPNPVEDPVACGLGNLSDYFSQNSTSPLFFCDPDPTTSTIDVEMISDQIIHFDSFFADYEVTGDTQDVLNDTAPNVTGVQLAVAVVLKMDVYDIDGGDVPASPVGKEDDDAKASNIFATTLFNNWLGPPDGAGTNGILIFLGIDQQYCSLIVGEELTPVLTQRVLQEIVESVEPDLEHERYGEAISYMITDIALFLSGNETTEANELIEIMSRFAVMALFVVLAFCFSAWSEYRTSRTQRRSADASSRLSRADRKKAIELQETYKTTSCPICLERFDDDGDPEAGETSALVPSRDSHDDLSHATEEGSFKMPEKGSDGKPIKLLRCGHIFCDSCWKSWVHRGGATSALFCPVCRQDVTESSRKRTRRRNASQSASADTAGVENSPSDAYGTFQSTDSNVSEGAEEASGGNDSLFLRPFNYFGLSRAHESREDDDTPGIS